MNWNEATLEQCRDFLAECRGWKKHLSHWHDEREGMEGLADVQYPFHPIAATIDSIAASLPEGWRWSRIEWVYREGGDSIDAYAFGETTAVVATGDSELLARARCACLAWEASGK